MQESFKDLRRRHNLTVEQAAQLLHMTVSGVRKIEQREKKMTEFTVANRRMYRLLEERVMLYAGA